MDKGKANQKGRRPTTSIVADIIDDEEIIETVYRPDLGRTIFIKGAGDEWRHHTSIETKSGETLVPISAHNNLLKHHALLLPEKPESYDSTETLIGWIEGYIHHYVDLSPTFEKIAARYVLLTWVFDAFNELPYLRFRGDYGSGKTRALIVIGSLCYRPFFASGASTTSPIFHVLDRYGATLIFDEADFRMSDEKSDLVKILNNGNVKGLPVLRTMPSADGKEFNPRAFSVFGPKIVANRGRFEDRALESRFITEEMGRRSPRSDIPINLPDEQKDEARALRNMLLQYRLRNRFLVFPDESLCDPKLEPRFNQILVPLLSVTDDVGVQREIQAFVRAAQSQFVDERGESIEGRVLETIAEAIAAKNEKSCVLGDLAQRFSAKFAEDFDRPMTSRWMGYIVRQKLGLSTFRRAGVYHVSFNEKEKLSALFVRYGLSEDAATISGQ